MEDGHGWTIISDQQKGLVDAISNLLPKVEHRLCARHVYANLRKKWKGLQYRDVFGRIAKSSNEVGYNKYIKEMQELDVGAWQFLENKDPKHFCRLFFKAYAKCDSIDNNMAEILNAFIIEERFMPIWTMLDNIFKKVMTRVASRKQMVDHLRQDMCPMILKKLEKAKDLCRWWHASRGGNGMYSVMHGSEGFIVDMLAKTCTCNAWELSGIPSHHALALMREENVDPTQFVHKCYSTSMLKKTYAYTLKPVNGPSLWSPYEDEPIVAQALTHLKGGLKKGKEDLRANTELYPVQVVPLSVQYPSVHNPSSNAVAINDPPSSSVTAGATTATPSAPSSSAAIASTSDASWSAATAYAVASVTAVETAPETTETAPETALEIAKIAPFSNAPVASDSTVVAAESGSLIESANHAHPFFDYPQKGKLPVRRYHIREVIPSQSTITFITLDD